jgi:hypothetical protein
MGLWVGAMYLQRAYGIIAMMFDEVSNEDRPLLDCQEYIVDLEMSVSWAVEALVVAWPNHHWEDHKETWTKLESEATKTREIALRRMHLEGQLKDTQAWDNFEFLLT